MPHGLIAELIRTRCCVDGVLSDSDFTICFAEQEAELLERRPELCKLQRYATRTLDPGVVLFLPALGSAALDLDIALALRAGGAAAPVDRHVGN